MDGILEDVTDLCTRIVTQLRDLVTAKLLTAGINVQQITGLLELFSEDSHFCQPFQNLHTYYRQLAFYKSHLNLVVGSSWFTVYDVTSLCAVIQEPVNKTLGSRHVVKGFGAQQQIVEKVDTFVYIPILSTLQSLMMNGQFYSEVQHTHTVYV